MSGGSHTTLSGRREFLGRAGLGSLLAALGGWPRRAAAADQDSPTATADRCILVFMTGGPSHLDLWDPKPQAPAEIRGPFRMISTSVPGVVLCEHLPKLARCLDRCSLVRSVHHDVSVHAAAAYVALTGQRGSGLDRPAEPSDHPALGAIMAQRVSNPAFPLPYVWLPYQTTEISLGLQPIPGILAGFLGPRFDPFFVLDDPSDPDFAVPSLKLPSDVPLSRLNGRMRLLDALATRSAIAADTPWSEFRDQARELITSSPLQRVFAMQDEPPALRDAYGDDAFGASLLLARRLIEAGSRVVGVSMGENLNNTWDTHDKNFTRLQGLIPKFDAGISSLICDLEERGLLERTLVVAFGEFGRTPKIDDKSAGRNHWPNCYTILMAGGGIRRGFVFGESDKWGAYPALDPVTPADILATLFHCLGIAAEGEPRLRDKLSRPIDVVPGGTAIPQLLG